MLLVTAIFLVRNFCKLRWCDCLYSMAVVKRWKTIKPQKVVTVTCEKCWFARFHLKGSGWEKFSVLE